MPWFLRRLRLRKVFAFGCLGCLLPMLLATAAALAWAIVATARADRQLPVDDRCGAGSAVAGGKLDVPGIPFPVPPASAAAAIPALELFARMAAAVYGPRSAEVGRELGLLAQLHSARGDLHRSQQLAVEAFDILGAQPSPGADLGWLSNNLGMVELARGETSEADELFRRALAVLPRERHFERAVVLQNVAATATELGHWQRAQSAYVEALAVLAKLGRHRSGPRAVAEHNYAVLRLAMGDAEGARQTCGRLLAGGAARTPRLRLALLIDLGEALRRLGRYQEAKRRLGEAVAVTAAGSVARAQVLSSLAVVHVYSGEPGAARATALRALEILEAQPRQSCAGLVAPLSTLATLALLERDLDNAERMFGRAQAIWQVRGSPDHPFSGSLEKGLALVALQRGDLTRARALAVAALALERRHFRRLLAFGSEAQRLAYRQQTFPYDLLANLGEARPLADAVLTTKGVVLASLLADRARARRAVSGRQGLATPAPGAAGSPTTAAAVAAADIDVARVQSALAPGEALLELLRFGRFEGRTQLVYHYGAVIVPAAGEPAWVALGPAAELEGLVGGLRHCLAVRAMGAEVVRGVDVDGDCGSNDELAATLAALHRRLWQPLERALPAGTRRAIVAADGALHFVPWAALADERGRFVAERLEIAQVTSGRDLLRPAHATGPKTLVALGRNGRLLRRAEEEVEQVAALARERGWEVELLDGERATEGALFAARSPAILHLATHGHFQRQAEIDARLVRAVPGPMLRSYVELAGGGGGAADGDGLLTAEEAAGLDLSRTWLTVLSACETGLGETVAGEGVLGLRRGFALAGSDHLMLALWTIGDDDAYAFVQRFYRHLFATADPVRAFADVQRSELVRLRRERSPQEAVLAVGGFVLTR
jgi:tetratricopeptide (TPR) repeat protein